MTTFVPTCGPDSLDLALAIRRAVIGVYATIDQPTASDYRTAHDIVRYMLTGTSPVALLKSANSAQPHRFYQQALEQIDRLVTQKPEVEPSAATFPTEEFMHNPENDTTKHIDAWYAHLQKYDLLDIEQLAQSVNYRVRSANGYMFDLEYTGGVAEFTKPGYRLLTFTEKEDAQAFLQKVNQRLAELFPDSEL